MDFHPGSGFGSSFASNILPINHLAPYLNSGACPALLSVNVRPPTPLGIGDEIPPVINKYKKLSQNSPKVGVLYNHLTCLRHRNLQNIRIRILQIFVFVY